ncbi:hypothetical protein [Janthinobacterium sp. UMAB-56]|uniref:hypothetical protein n=1 Tax=Janthinobacterium sp. UMAB-56 TaxID=1365361 RepID=UPI001C564E3D|nr:hypothetical protein [Janthinobacterium sp. UMAB-56]
MKLEPGKFCPLIKKDCLQLGCSWFTQVRGKNPQTGADVDEWACAIVWMPLLTINTADEVRQCAAATESLRNELAVASAGASAIQSFMDIHGANKRLVFNQKVPE